MQTVNYHLLFSALNNLIHAEYENGGPFHIDPDNEKCMKELFSEHISPEIARWSDKRRKKLKYSFAYFINKPDILDYKVLADLQDFTMPKEPSDISKFFLWLFEVLFPDEIISSIDLSNIEENNDIMQTNFEPGELS